MFKVITGFSAGPRNNVVDVKPGDTLSKLQAEVIGLDVVNALVASKAIEAIPVIEPKPVEVKKTEKKAK